MHKNMDGASNAASDQVCIVTISVKTAESRISGMDGVTMFLFQYKGGWLKLF